MGPERYLVRSAQTWPHMQADLGIDDDLLAGGNPVGVQRLVEPDIAFDQCQRDRTQLVMACAAANPAHGLTCPISGTVE